MKRCPTCNRTFSDPTLSFCTDDGTPLVHAQPETSEGNQPGSNTGNNDQWSPAPYQPPGSYTSPATQPKRNALPWVVTVIVLMVAAVAGLAIAAVVMFPRWRQTPRPRDGRVVTTNSNANEQQNNGGTDNSNSNLHPSNTNTIAGLPNVNSNVNANTNSNSNVNANDNASSNPSAPFDKDQVLAQLTELEHEWTVANLNADKKALARILADDYVAQSATGMQGKIDYINNAQRDTTIERWDFQNLKLTLHGDRATLAGQLKVLIQGQERIFNFVDKFVWRDGRWQATGSQVNLVQ